MAMNPEPSRVPLHIAIFSRAPVAGQTKTRLIPGLGAAGAAALARQMLDQTGETVATIAARGDASASLWTHPDSSHPCLRQISQRHTLRLSQQYGPDLGFRMAHALRRELRKAHKVIIVGSDCPGLKVADLQDAAAALDRVPAVLGPTVDGGYYLIGARRPLDLVLRRHTWGHARALAQTVARMGQLGLAWERIAVRQDVDEVADLISTKS